MENENVIVKEKSNKGLKILLVILILIVLGLSGYLVYDKFINKEDNKSTTKATTNNNTQVDNSNKKVLKKDESKEIVYTLYTGKSSDNMEVIVPEINIDSKYTERVNSDIRTIMLKDYKYNGANGIICNSELCPMIKYKYYVNNNILSLVIYVDYLTDPLNHNYYTYNIDIYTGEEITNKDLSKIKNIDINDFSTKLSNTFKEAYPFDKYYDGNNNYSEEKEFAQKTYSMTTDSKNCSIDNPMFLNENGELNVILGVYYYAGGEGSTDNILNIDAKQFIYYDNFKM